MAPSPTLERVLTRRQRSTLQLRDEGDRTVVLKVLAEDSPSRSELARFTTELEIAGALDLPGVRRVLRLEDADGRPALVMEFVDGETLADTIGDGLPLGRFLPLARQLAVVLASVHARGVIHRDLSPANVIVTPDGAPVLIDFGLAARLDTKVHHLGNPRSLRGTLAYLSPEQTGRMNRFVDHRTDLYALGAICYHMLTGQPPFRADRPIDLVHAHLALRPPPPHEIRPEIPVAVSRLVLRLLEKSADDRYQSAGGVAHDLGVMAAQHEQGGIDADLPLGAQDLSDRLQLPQRLYGREAQATTLLDAFERAAAGSARLVLVRGAAGAGKSALVQEVHRALTAHDGCFADGKFDQLQRVPFQAFLQALDAYAAQLLIEPPDALALWRARIQQAVGEVGAVLTALSPRLEQVLGVQAPLSALSGASEEQNRFFYVMRRFVAAVARADRPLVLFLDDLQWADVNSIALLKNLLTTPEGQHLLLIGAYRDDEVDGSHPLQLVVDELQRAAAPIDTVDVGDLARDDLAALIGDALRVRPDRAAPLAALVYDKTRGNPFFARRFLTTLHQEGAVRFDHAAGAWAWDLDRCHALDLTDNVVEFMARRAARLPEEAQRVLKIAACVGGRFDLDALSVVAEEGVEALRAALWPALEDGLVLALADGMTDAEEADQTYRFAHDRIRQAVYSLLDAEARTELHARIGQLLLERTDPSRRDERLFDVVNQLNLALERITAPERRIELARLNTRAGRRAMGSAAYEHALRYLTVAADLLPGDAWAAHPELCLELHTLRAEAALLSGPDRAAVEDSAGQVITNARAPQDKMPAYDILLQMPLLRQEVHQAIEVGLRALRELDVTFPANPKLGHIVWALLGTKWALWGRDVEALIDLPPLEDPRVAAVLPMIERICPAAFRVGSNLFPLLTLRLLDLTLAHGNAGPSTFAYGAYGITSCGVLGDIDTGYRFGRLAMDLCDRLNADNWRAKSEFMWANFIRHWKEPLQNSVDGNRETYLVGLKTGAMYEAVWGALYEIGLRFHLDSVLPEIERRLDAQADLLAWDGSVAANARLLRQVVGGLSSEETPEPWVVSGRWFDETAEATSMREGRDHTGLCCYHLYSAWLGTLFDRHARALEHLAGARQYGEAITSMAYVPVLELHDALGHLAAHRAGVAGAKLAVARKAVGRFEKWSRFNPANQAHRLALIRAEIDRTTGGGHAAPGLYDEAIEGAAAARFTQEEARALELAGEFYLERGRTPIAAMYLQRATEAYARWGAWAKVRQLRQSYPEHTRVQRASADHSEETPDGTIARSGDELDLQSIADAANALSAEIVLEQLIDKLLHITTSNAGAERGALLLTREGSLYLAAHLHHGALHRDDPADLPLPWSILNYCERTQESVVLADAARTGMFRDDPVVQAHRIRSVLCVPLVRSKELLGVIYLDNNLVSDAFTAERGRSVRLLAGQAATSIRNAQLYAHLQRTLDQQVALNHATARFVPVEFLRSLSRNNLQEVELGDSAQKVMSILFSDIRSFTSLVESLQTSEALLGFINEYLSFAEPSLLDAGGFIDSYNGDGVMALFEDADAAVAGATGMQRGLARYNRIRAGRGERPLVTGIGVSTGSVMMGTIGGNRRMKCGVIGDPVNTAARVEGLTKEYKANVLITGHTRNQLRRPEAVQLRRVDRIRPVGKTEALTLYQVLDAEPDDLRELLVSYRDEFEAAMDAFYARDFEQALDKVRRCLQVNTKDAIAWRLAARCEALALSGVPEDWDGVVQMSHK